MKKYFLKRNMGSKGTSYRNEQIRALRVLRKYFKNVYAEYPVHNLTIDGYPEPNAILDICIIDGDNKLAIRLNGGYHFDSSKQRSKDEWQKMALEEGGWRVVDFNEDDMPILWNDKSDMKEVEEEVMNLLSDH